MNLNYKTNGSEFDFAEFNNFPNICYVMASSPRCGSNMLQRALWKTNAAGATEEYFAPRYIEDYSKRWENITGKNGEVKFEDYIKYLFRYRTSPNGVFGIKLHGSHLNSILKNGINLQKLLHLPKYIWVKRKNKIYQAVSYSLANQTDVWIIDGKWLPNNKPKVNNPKYDKNQIFKCLKSIIKDEQEWEAFFLKNKIQPFVVYYEDLLTNYKHTVGECFVYLGIDFPHDKIPLPGIDKQASEINDDWAERYFKDIVTG